jgi:hypothetical protein
MFHIAMGFLVLLFVFQIFIGYKISVLIDKIIEKTLQKKREQLIRYHKSKVRVISNIEHSEKYSFCYDIVQNNSSFQKKTCSFSSIVIPDHKKKDITLSSIICCGCGNYINIDNSGLYKKQIMCNCS